VLSFQRSGRVFRTFSLFLGGQQFGGSAEHHYLYNPEQQLGPFAAQQLLAQEQSRNQQQPQAGPDQMLQVVSQQESREQS
jgi:hypothetical protein